MPKVTSDKNRKCDLDLRTIESKWYFTDQAFLKLRTFLGNVEKGQSSVFTAPFADGDEMEKILSDWDKVLMSIQRKWPTLVEFEHDLAKKVGPMSVMKPIRDRMPDIEHYYGDILLSSNPVDPQAIRSVQQEFSRLRGLRLRSQDNTVDKMKKSTNSGNPFWSKRRDVVQETVPVTLIDVRQGIFDPRSYIMHLNRGNWRPTAVVGWRGQEGGPEDEDVKQRVVWMFPLGINILELQVYQPLIEGAQNLDLVPAWVSMESVDRRITQLFDTKGQDDLIVCTDFSRFDQHFNHDMQLCARTILHELLTPNLASKRWLQTVFPLKYEIPMVIGLPSRTSNKRKRSKLAPPKQRKLNMLFGDHGMASGSGGTNVDETLAHRALQYEAALRHNSELNPNSQCLGDDGILSYPGITVEDVVKAYEAHGQECNPDKQYASIQDCVYLRRWHHKDYRIDGTCVGVYSTCRALGRLRYLERWMDPEWWSPEMVALRQLSIIENCKWHPLFHEFIEFCMARDKYRLGINIPGFLANITKLAKEATDHIQDFLGYTKTLQGEGPSGIADWEVVKYLKSKA